MLLGGGLLAVLALAGLGPAMCARQAQRKSGIAQGGRPRRPPGEPKPLLEEDIAPVLARLDAWYGSHLPRDRYRFNPPASDADIEALDHLVGFRMPRAWRQLYRWHDGENDDRLGHIYGLPLLPLQQVADQWRSWTRVLADFAGDRYAIAGGAWPEGAVDPAYINRAWIPLTHDGSGNHIGIDFDPWPRGRVGQVILYGRDEDVKAVLAESLGTFLGWIADLLESGNFRLDEERGAPRLRTFRLRTPPGQDFQEGARILVGAPGPFL